MILKILQGILVGIGSILPGVSGGMIAASFNIYSSLIEALDNFTKHPIKAIKSIWEYIIGILIGILIGFLIISYIFYLVPIPSTMLFIGLILGGIPEIYFLAKQERISIKGIIITLITLVIMLSFAFIEPGVPNNSNSTSSFIIWIIVGAILALSLIVPGLSGTMLIMMLGYYGALLSTGKNVIKAVLTINFKLFFDNIVPLIGLFIGLAIAFIILGKLFNFILKKYPKVFYQVILGIVLSAPINIVFSLRTEMIEQTDIFDLSKNWMMWLIGLLLIPLGIYIARLFIRKEHETKEN